LNHFNAFHLSTNLAVFTISVQHGYHTFITTLDFYRAALHGHVITITVSDPFIKPVVIYEVLLDSSANKTHFKKMSSYNVNAKGSGVY